MTASESPSQRSNQTNPKTRHTTATVFPLSALLRVPHALILPAIIFYFRGLKTGAPDPNLPHADAHPTPFPSARCVWIQQAAAGASRPSSVSPLTTVLGVLVAFTASSPVGAAAATAERHDVGDCGVVTDSPSVGSCNGSPRYGHEIVVEEAFACLMGLAGAAPESSAQAECVKAALVALKECAQVGWGGAKRRGVYNCPRSLARALVCPPVCPSRKEPVILLSS